MDVIDELRAFVATAQTGSFTAAAGRLGVSNRLTSKYVAELEARLGVRLLQRTTRRVGLTPAGEDLLARAPALLDELDTLLAGIAENRHDFTGTIRVSAPVTFGETFITGLLARFAEQNPGVNFDLRLNDLYADLAREGIDVAFRIGRTETLSLKVRKLGEVRSITVASRDYIHGRGVPDTPEELVHHDCIVDTNRRAPRRWMFERGGTGLAVDVQGRFQVNSASAAVELAAAGLGIAHIPRFALHGPMETGRLQTILDRFDGRPSPVSAIYLEGRTLPRKVRALIDFAARDIRSVGIL